MRCRRATSIQLVHRRVYRTLAMVSVKKCARGNPNEIQAWETQKRILHGIFLCIGRAILVGDTANELIRARASLRVYIFVCTVEMAPESMRMGVF